MIKVYIAAPYPTRDISIGLMNRLEDLGFEVTSTWLKAPDEMADAFARVDLADVARADCLLALNSAEWVNSGTGGRHVELGYALALGKAIVLYGERSNIFHHLKHVALIDDVLALPSAIRSSVHAAKHSIIYRDNAVSHVLNEFASAEAKHKPMNSPHEGKAVIEEELDELWDEVKADRGRTQAALYEAVQVAAMGLRYVRDLSLSELPQPADAVDPQADSTGTLTTRDKYSDNLAASDAKGATK